MNLEDITMITASTTSIHELDHRNGDGIDVTLLWNPGTGRVSLGVIDERSGEALMFEVNGADAMAAFHHPYAYAPRSRVTEHLTSLIRD